MDLTSIKNIKDFLEKTGSKPSKGLGQNFLINSSVLQKIIDSAELTKDDVILEVGPGLGVLTKELAQNAKQVIAIEKDQKMVEILKETLKEYPNVIVIHGDALGYNIDLRDYKVIANIPYYITSPLIRKFLEDKNPPREIVLMVQKEVAKRICSIPPDMNLLAVSVQFYAKAKIATYVKKENFWPKPKVDSAVIKITPNKIECSIPIDLFFKIVKAGFSQPRKQLLNNLSKGLDLDKDKIASWLMKNNLKPIQRAETLEIEDWINLTKSFSY